MYCVEKRKQKAGGQGKKDGPDQGVSVLGGDAGAWIVGLFSSHTKGSHFHFLSFLLS